jgi:uncharacterized protein YggU (UPF0235/DUF167 family)
VAKGMRFGVNGSAVGGPESGRPFTIGAKAILLRVKAKPGAREDRVQGVRNGELLVSVRAAPENGKANIALVRVLSEYSGVGKSDVILKTGAGAPHKIFELPISCLDSLVRALKG